MIFTSGSTGVPTMSPFTKKDFDEFQETESRWFWQIGMRPNDRYVHALNFSLYVGGPDVIGAQNLGALCIWGGTLPSERLLFILKTYQPTVIWTSPSYAWQLGEKALKSGYDPKKDFNIKKIIVAGELGGSIDATRKAIEDIWGAEVFDFYGLSDISAPAQHSANITTACTSQKTTSSLRRSISTPARSCRPARPASWSLRRSASTPDR